MNVRLCLWEVVAFIAASSPAFVSGRNPKKPCEIKPTKEHLSPRQHVDSYTDSEFSTCLPKRLVFLSRLLLTQERKGEGSSVEFEGFNHLISSLLQPHLRFNQFWTYVNIILVFPGSTCGPTDAESEEL
ncbi:hypothetical protein DY000_02031547 [Brassica cretica]|uniref:Uncharacterized protein n=1 Tax=Brassica cretica TaxID=69181 RepID=A0ABQ7DKI2_BRACR|nr:hypothetical protein DY000_02031547 [Brassica cretica]